MCKNDKSSPIPGPPQREGKRTAISKGIDSERPLSFDLKKLVRPNIWKLKPYSSARDEFDLYGSDKNEVILLDANENGYPSAVKKDPPAPFTEGGLRGLPYNRNENYRTSGSTHYEILKNRARSLRNNPTKAEEILWQSLRKKRMGYRFRRQHVIDYYIADFACMQPKVVVELDGEIHKGQTKKDEERTARLNEFGFNVIRFNNEEVLADTNAVVQELENFMRRMESDPLSYTGKDEPKEKPTTVETEDLALENSNKETTNYPPAPFEEGGVASPFRGGSRGWPQLNRYPDPYQSALKSTISQLKSIPADQIFLGNGSDEAIDLIYRIFCEPAKDQVITCPPTYGMYEVSAAINDVEVIEVPLQADFSLSLDKIKSQKGKILWVCSPNNPTGNITATGLAFEELIKDFDGIVVIDEAYHDFTKQPSWTKRLDEFQNLIVLQTFSKAYGMAGARVGMAFASTEIIRLFNKVKPPYNVNELSQRAVAEQLENTAITNQQIDQIIQSRVNLEKELNELQFVQKVWPSETNFLLVQVSDADRLYTYLKDEGIIIRNRSSQIDNAVRFTVGTELENKELIRALRLYATL